MLNRKREIVKTPETLYEWIFDKPSIKLSLNQYIDDSGYECLDIKLVVYETIYEEITSVQVVREQHLNGSEVPDNEKDLINYLDWMYEDASKEYDIKARHKRFTFYNEKAYRQLYSV